MSISTFLMFEGKAEEAMRFYTTLFPSSTIESIALYGENEQGPAGKVHHAVFVLDGHRFMCIDSPVQHGFTFTPAMSLHVMCESEAEVDAAYAALSDGGQVLMPLGSYPFSKRYAWLNDRYGVSWQLALREG